MLKHGENIVDLMGGEIDRIEMKLRVCISSIFVFNIKTHPKTLLFQKKFPEIRHCDLEIL